MLIDPNVYPRIYSHFSRTSGITNDVLTHWWILVYIHGTSSTSIYPLIHWYFDRPIDISMALRELDANCGGLELTQGNFMYWKSLSSLVLMHWWALAVLTGILIFGGIYMLMQRDLNPSVRSTFFCWYRLVWVRCCNAYQSVVFEMWGLQFEGLLQIVCFAMFAQSLLICICACIYII